jgi:ribosomal protein S18 acetylase RimI-like enzyme
MTAMALTIRPYQPADEDTVVALWHACGLTRPWNDPRKDIARKRTVQPEWFLVGVDDDGLVVATAMAGYDGQRGWVNYLAVAPDHRGRGHATALMTRIEDLLRAAGCPKLNLQVRASNEAAVAFYRKLGFAEDAAISFGKRLIPDTPPT